MVLTKKIALLSVIACGVCATAAVAEGTGTARMSAGVNKLLIATGIPSVSQPFTVPINPQTGIITAGATPPISFTPPITVFSNDPTAVIKVTASGALNYGGTTPITNGFTGTIPYSTVTVFGKVFQADGSEQVQPLGATALSTENLANAPVLSLLSSADVPVAGDYTSVVNIEVTSL